MAIFILKLNNELIDFVTLPPGVLKQSISDLQKSITGQLDSVRCDTHHHEPIIFLRAEAHAVRLTGISVCCATFGREVRGILHLPPEVMDRDVAVTTRTTSYTYYS